MPRVGFEPKITVTERVKTFHALYSAATVIGINLTYEWNINHNYEIFKIWIYLLATETTAVSGNYTAFYPTGIVVFLLRVKKPNSEINSSPQWNEEIKNVWNFASILLMPRELAE
jgi:hypothetical protein